MTRLGTIDGALCEKPLFEENAATQKERALLANIPGEASNTVHDGLRLPSDILLMADVLHDLGNYNDSLRIVDDYTSGNLPADWRIKYGVVCAGIQTILNEMGLRPQTSQAEPLF